MARERVTISMSPALLKWVDKHIMDHYEYKDRSHFVEVLIRRYKDSLEKKG
jgi:metal-responsive CopG/Arc/MetJ family transcriptional regulator